MERVCKHGWVVQHCYIGHIHCTHLHCNWSYRYSSFSSSLLSPFSSSLLTLPLTPFGCCYPALSPRPPPRPRPPKKTTTAFPFPTPKGDHKTTISTPFLILMPPNPHNSTQLPNILMIPNLPATTHTTPKNPNKKTNNKSKIKTKTTETTITTTTTIKIRMILLMSSNGLA